MKYIIRYTGDKRPNTTAIKKLLAKSNINIVDDSNLPSMMLVDTDKDISLSGIQELLPKGWTGLQMREAYQVPDTRRKIIKGTGK